MTSDIKAEIFPVRFIIFILTILFFPAIVPSAAMADTYKWIDASGTIHLSDDPTDMPVQHRKNYQIIPDRPKTSGSITIPFEKTATGLILVDTLLNDDVQARMVLDTGADTVVVTGELLKKLNQDLLPGSEETNLRTNCGIVKGRFIVIDKIKLGDAAKENVRAVVTPNEIAPGGFDGLLGISFLGDFKITVDYQSQMIIINK